MNIPMPISFCRICLSALLASLLIVPWSSSAADPPLPALQGSWLGAAGPVGSQRPQDPTALPLNLWPSIAGRLALTLTKPAVKSPNGSYSATLSLFDGTMTWALKGNGIISGSNTIQGDWISPVKGAPKCRVTLALSGSSNPICLSGNALLISGTGVDAVTTSYPLFALPLTYNAKTNPLPAADVGPSTLFLFDSSSDSGTGTGSVTMSAIGAVRLAITLNNGKKISLSSNVLSYAGNEFFFFFYPTAKDATFSGWAAKDTSQPTSDWAGLGILSSDALPLDLRLVRYTKPLPGTPVLPWRAHADLYLVHPDFLVGFADVSLTAGNKLVAVLSDGTALISLSLAFNPASGVLTGLAKYPVFPSPLPPAPEPPPISASINGALNQKTGMFYGSIQPKTSRFSGLVEIAPQP